MYAEDNLLFPHLQNFSLDDQQSHGYCNFYEPDSPMSNLFQTMAISDYDYGVESDLFKAPETIIEEPMGPISEMFSCSEDVISSQASFISDFMPIQSEQQLLDEAFYACERDLMAKSAMESPLPEGGDVKIPVTNETLIGENNATDDIALPKSESSGSLSSMDWVHRTTMEPNFLDFGTMDFGAVYKMRRAFSEGDIKILNNTKVKSACGSALDWVIGNCTSEDRKEKLSRYKNKKSKRNFGRKIKYACRKALADSQPRIRGRFARTEEADSTKR